MLYSLLKTERVRVVYIFLAQFPYLDCVTSCTSSLLTQYVKGRFICILSRNSTPPPPHSSHTLALGQQKNIFGKLKRKEIRLPASVRIGFALSGLDPK